MIKRSFRKKKKGRRRHPHFLLRHKDVHCNFYFTLRYITLNWSAIRLYTIEI